MMKKNIHINNLHIHIYTLYIYIYLHQSIKFDDEKKMREKSFLFLKYQKEKFLNIDEIS